VKLHYLSIEEKEAIETSIPWGLLDRRILELVRVANELDGIVTVQSCAGHISPITDGFHVRDAHIALRATESRARQILFDVAPSVGISDVELRYFRDGTFWIKLIVHPTEHFKFFELLEMLGREGK